MVPIAHPSAIQVVKRHPVWENWWTISHKDFDACPQFSWWSIFSVTGMKFDRVLTKRESKIVTQAKWGGAYSDKLDRQQEAFRQQEARDVAALEDWVQTRISTSASSSGP